jgi:hypothetical protein
VPLLEVDAALLGVVPDQQKSCIMLLGKYRMTSMTAMKRKSFCEVLRSPQDWDFTLDF